MAGRNRFTSRIGEDVGSDGVELRPIRFEIRADSADRLADLQG